MDLTPADIFDIIEDDRECMGYGQIEAFDQMDPVYCVLDHILQMARNEIDDVLGYDFQNDFRGDTEFYTYGNFMCSGYDWSEAAKDDLTNRLDEASSEQLRQLRDNKFVAYFLKQVEIDISEPA